MTDDRGYRGGWCIHYGRKTMNATCAAGVDYLAKWENVPFDERACFLDAGKPKPNARHCEHLRLPTAEEIERRRVWSAAHIEKLTAAMVKIMEWRENRTQDAEIIPCPTCGGRLHVAVARRNGHMAARCETRDCIQFIQ